MHARARARARVSVSGGGGVVGAGVPLRLHALPDDVLWTVCALLNGSALCALAGTCRRLAAIVLRDDSVWKVSYARVFERSRWAGVDAPAIASAEPALLALPPQCASWRAAYALRAREGRARAAAAVARKVHAWRASRAQRGTGKQCIVSQLGVLRMRVHVGGAWRTVPADALRMSDDGCTVALPYADDWTPPARGAQARQQRIAVQVAAQACGDTFVTLCDIGALQREQWELWPAKATDVVDVAVCRSDGAVALVLWKGGRPGVDAPCALWIHLHAWRIVWAFAAPSAHPGAPPRSPFTEPRAEAYFDDIDSRFGLHGLSVRVTLRTFRHVLWQTVYHELQIADAAASGDGAHVELVVFRSRAGTRVGDAVGDEQRLRAGVAPTLEWRAAALQGAVEHACVLDLVVYDEFVHALWIDSVPVHWAPASLGTTRLALSELAAGADGASAWEACAERAGVGRCRVVIDSCATTVVELALQLERAHLLRWFGHLGPPLPPPPPPLRTDAPAPASRQARSGSGSGSASTAIAAARPPAAAVPAAAASAPARSGAGASSRSRAPAPPVSRASRPAGRGVAPVRSGLADLDDDDDDHDE